MAIKSSGTLVGAGAGFVILACMAGWFAWRLIRSNRDQVLASGALVPEQQFNLAGSGEVLILLETPRLEVSYPNLKFAVVELATGTTTTMSYHYTQAQGAVHVVSTVRIPFGSLTAPRPGAYLVRVTGLDPTHDYSRLRILVSRPYLGRMTVQIVGIVLCSIAALLCLILATWQIFPPQSSR
jgi:hypothetical protein